MTNLIPACTRRLLRGSFALAAAFVLLLGAARAASPPVGRTFTGVTSAPKEQGFSAKVSFRTASSTRLSNFVFQTLGCLGAGGFPPGANPYAYPYAKVTVGSLKVSPGKTTRFSVRNARSTFHSRGQTTVTTSAVSGSFTSRSSARGTITFSQHFTGRGFPAQTCGPVSVTFTAKLS